MDDWLKHCWGQVLQINVENQDPMPTLSVAYFIVKNRLLYYHCTTAASPVISSTKIDNVMDLAHAHLLDGHLGPRNILEKTRDQFQWPGMVTEVSPLPMVPLVPENTTLEASSGTLNSSALHQGPIQMGGHGPARATPKVCLWL